MFSEFRTVVVLGASYAGHRAVQMLVSTLPEDWRVVVIERNSHFNHLYTFSRLAVFPGHEHKAFIPYTKIFKPKSCPGNATPTDAPEPVASHQFLHANVTLLLRNRVYFKRLSGSVHDDQMASYIDFDYLVYALGSHLPAPINIWSSSRSFALTTPYISQESLSSGEDRAGTKQESINWLRDAQKRIQTSRSVLVIGGGALGVQFATDIADMFPEKPVTLVHSRSQLLPRFDKWMHDSALKRLEDLGVTTLLNTRIDLQPIRVRSASPYLSPDISLYSFRASSPALSTPELSTSPCSTPGSCSPFIPSFDLPSLVVESEQSDSIVVTTDGTKIQADLILLCTGQIQNTTFLESLSPQSINRANSGAAYVLPTLQLATKGEKGKLTLSECPHVFVIGDAADAFGALKSGNAAWYQAELAVRNIVKMIRDQGEELENYSSPPPGIKVSLGFKHAIHQAQDLTFEHIRPEECDMLLNIDSMWKRRGLAGDDMTI